MLTMEISAVGRKMVTASLYHVSAESIPLFLLIKEARWLTI
jgi:hypothetical protein